MSVEINARKNDGQVTSSLCVEDEMYIDTVNNKLTLYGQLPYSIPKRMIIEMIKSAARMFYKYYYNALTRTYLFVNKNDILEISKKINPNDYFNGFRGYFIPVHPSVRAVRNIVETDLEEPESVNDVVQTLAWGVNPQYYGQSLIGINNNLYITEYTTKMIEISAMKSIFRQGVPFSFNPLESILIIKRKLEHSIILDVERDIPLKKLYNDELFDRYVIALCKIELKRLVGSHTIPLPGDVQLNVEELCQGSTEEKEKVEEILKAGSGIGDLIIQRS